MKWTHSLTLLYLGDIRTPQDSFSESQLQKKALGEPLES